jgi:predicted transcriptional regulator
VTEMAEVVNRDATAIDAHLAGLERLELLNASGEGVGEAQGHR